MNFLSFKFFVELEHGETIWLSEKFLRILEHFNRTQNNIYFDKKMCKIIFKHFLPSVLQIGNSFFIKKMQAFRQRTISFILPFHNHN